MPTYHLELHLMLIYMSNRYESDVEESVVILLKCHLCALGGDFSCTVEEMN